MKQLAAVLLLLTIICFPIFTHDQIVVKTPPKKVHKVQKIIVYKYVTAYCSCRICSGEYGNLTASGKTLKEGMIAASRSIPFGTRIRINGKVYVVEDRLAERYDYRIDIYSESHSKALRWGIRKLRVEIIKN